MNRCDRHGNRFYQSLKKQMLLTETGVSVFNNISCEEFKIIFICDADGNYGIPAMDLRCATSI